MRKIIVKLLLIMTATICFSIGTACSSSSVEQGTNEPCDNHSFTNYVSNNDATVDADGTKTATCDNQGCFETDTVVDVGSKILAVIIELDNGEERTIITKKPGEPIDEIPEPTKPGAIFKGWSTEIPEIMPSESLTITAQWLEVLIINDDVVSKVTEYGKTLTTIEVPEGIKTIDVCAFSYCDYLENVILPKSIVTIKDFAFEYCSNLSQIDLPDGLKTIGSRAFIGCWSLTKLKMPATLESVGTTIFSGDRAVIAYTELQTTPSSWDPSWNVYGWFGDLSLYSPVVYNCNENDVADDGNIYLDYNGLRYAISDGIAKIAIQPYNLKEANISSSITYKEVTYPVKELMPYAFYYCSYLPDVIVPDSVIKVADNAFCEPYNDTSEYQNPWNPLLTIYMKHSNKLNSDDFRYFGDNVVWDCYNNTVAEDGNEYAFIDNIKYRLKDGKATIMSFQRNDVRGEIVIPSVVHYKEKFYTVTEIAFWAFNGCKLLEKITIPETVCYISNDAFEYCVNLKEIVIDNANDYYKVVDDILYTKDGKELLWCLPTRDSGEIIVPNGVEVIKSNSFGAVKNATKVVLPEGLKVIEKEVFGNSKIEEINLPESLETIEGYAFYGCEQLKSIVIPSNVDMIVNSFSNCYNLETVIICEGVEILYGVFENCTSLKSIVIPNGVKVIDYSFNGCTNLEYVKLPASLNSLNLSFNGCEKLRSIEVEDSNVFKKGTYSLKEIEIMQLLASTNFEGFEDGDELVSTTKDGVSYIGTIKNPYLCVDGADESLTEINIHEDCKLIYELPYNELSIVNFEMSLDKALEIVCVRVGNRNVKVQGEIVTEIVTGNAKTVANKMFSYNKNLQKIVISSSLISICDYAFAGCENLTTIEYEENSSLKYIGKRAFEGCYDLTGFEIPSSVEMIGDYAIPELQKSVYFNDGGLYYLGNSENPYIYLAKITSKETLINSECKFFGPRLLCWENDDAFSLYAAPNSLYLLPKNLLSIDSDAFYSVVFDTSNDKQTIKDGLRYIGNESNPYMCLIGTEYYYEEDLVGVLIKNKELAKINVKDGCTIIMGRFSSNVTIEVNLPESVRVISDEAFYNLEYLDMVVIPKSVIKMGETSFHKRATIIYEKYLG